jgi:hypothetical protein
LIGSLPDADSVETTRYSDLNPVIASALAAACAVAFYRVWVLFSADLGGPVQVGLSGARLAQEAGRSMPWLYITPAALVLILLLSFLRLFAKSTANRMAFAVLLPIVSLVLGIWPVNEIARISARLHAASGGPTMALSPWWWIYCLSLSVVIVIGITDLGASIRSFKRKSGPPVGSY